MTGRPRLLDLYCGAGIGAMGYADLFDVVGVDIEPQPHYPFPFIQANALDVLRKPGLFEPPFAANFDAIHASPPCQAFTVLRNALPGRQPRWGDLIAPTRQLLEQTGLPWVMENVPGAPLRDPVQLCGTSFGIPVRRHRLFEASFPITPIACAHTRFTERRFPGSSNRPNGRTVCNIGEYRVPLDVQKDCMQVDHDVTLHELSEGIPPVFTRHVGLSLIAYLERLHS